MKPIDYRNATFEALKSRITGQRMRVYEGYRDFGPCTTRNLSQWLQISILSVRPRTTELVDLGFVVCLPISHQPSTIPHDPHEGVYAAVPEAAVRESFENQKREATQYEQRQLL